MAKKSIKQKTTPIKVKFTRHIKSCMGSENPNLKLWYCGITNNEVRRRYEHKRNSQFMQFWICIKTNSVEEANEVEAYFSNKGTSNRFSKNGANNQSMYVYLFKKYTQSEIKAKGLGSPDIVEQMLLDFFNMND